MNIFRKKYICGLAVVFIIYLLSSCGGEWEDRKTVIASDDEIKLIPSPEALDLIIPERLTFKIDRGLSTRFNWGLLRNCNPANLEIIVEIGEDGIPRNAYNPSILNPFTTQEGIISNAVIQRWKYKKYMQGSISLQFNSHTEQISFNRADLQATGEYAGMDIRIVFERLCY